MKVYIHGLSWGKQYRNNAGNAIMMTNSARGGLARPARGCFLRWNPEKMQAGSTAAAHSFAYAITGSVS